MGYLLYVVSDLKISGGLSYQKQAELAFAGGCDAFQLRAKDLCTSDLIREARGIMRVKERFEAENEGYHPLFFVNDSIEAAVESGADGVHLGQGDMSIAEAKKENPHLIAGLSAGNVEETLKGIRDGADYVALSPIFDTASKSDAGRGNGLNVLCEMRAAVPEKYPLLAIGGINAGNAPDVIRAGADGCAVISAVLAAPDITEACRNLRAVIKSAYDREHYLY